MNNDSIFSQIHPDEDGQSVFDQTTETLKREIDVLGKIHIGMIIAMITIFACGFMWLLLFIG